MPKNRTITHAVTDRIRIIEQAVNKVFGILGSSRLNKTNKEMKIINSDEIVKKMKAGIDEVILMKLGSSGCSVRIKIGRIISAIDTRMERIAIEIIKIFFMIGLISN